MITITSASSNDALQGRCVPPPSLNPCTVTLFSGLPLKDFPSGMIRRYPKNAIVINQGDPISSLYFILSGRIKLYMSNQRGKAFILDIRGPGDYFGDLELVDVGPCIASAVTLEESWMYAIQDAYFERFLSEHPEIDRRFYRSLVQRTRPLIERINSLALDPVYGRVIRTLLGSATEREGKLVTERLTQQDLADRVGACREMVKLILKSLEEGGYIKVENKRITLLKREFPPAW
jgi:CRP/FNR family transcriptional regulator, cyclic AMP receptor protein